MEAKDLMIGDWVQNTCGHKGRVIGFRYDAYDEYNEIVIAYHSNNTTWSQATLIEPIPLTEEILKANGFRNVDNVWLSVDDSFGIDNQEGLMEFFKYRMFEDDSVLEAQIPYCYNVHELQRTLRCCKMNELADNFIIK